MCTERLILFQSTSTNLPSLPSTVIRFYTYSVPDRTVGVLFGLVLNLPTSSQRHQHTAVFFQAVSHGKAAFNQTRSGRGGALNTA